MTIAISPNAINQASNRVRRIWMDTRYPATKDTEGEGLYSWLSRMAKEALITNDRTPSGKYRQNGMKMDIECCAAFDTTYPIDTRFVVNSVQRITK